MIELKMSLIALFFPPDKNSPIIEDDSVNNVYKIGLEATVTYSVWNKIWNKLLLCFRKLMMYY